MVYLEEISFNNVYSITTKINEIEYKLSSHRYYNEDILSPNESKIMFHCDDYYGQQWVFVEKYKGLYEIRLNEDDLSFNRIGFYLNVNNNDVNMMNPNNQLNYNKTLDINPNNNNNITNNLNTSNTINVSNNNIINKMNNDLNTDLPTQNEI